MIVFQSCQLIHCIFSIPLVPLVTLRYFIQDFNLAVSRVQHSLLAEVSHGEKETRRKRPLLVPKEFL